MEEPSVLDYLKSRLAPWKGSRIVIPTNEQPQPAVLAPALAVEAPSAVPAERERADVCVPWRFMLALLFAVIAQALLEPKVRAVEFALILYALSALLIVWAIVRDRDLPGSIASEEVISTEVDERQKRMVLAGLVVVLGCLLFVLPHLLLGAFILWGLAVGYLFFTGELRLGGGYLLLIVAFITFTDDRFTSFNVLTWLAGIALIVSSLWVSKRSFRTYISDGVDFIRRPRWTVNLTRWTLVLLLVFAVIAFFRFYRLSQVPGEMFSDHAEKLLDVNDLLNGQTKIFFERNTGREFFQFYLTAAIIQLFHTGISFISLKLGTALAGLVTLPFIYLLGKEIGNRWVGLFALILAGIAYWPNVISRIGLRFPLYPLFVAPTLYFLIRGLRSGSRNNFILSGLFLGLGLHGYSPIRFLPLVVIAAVILFMLHEQSRGRRMQAFWALLLVAVVAFMVFLPLFRYALDNPDMFSVRALSRMTGSERPLPGPLLAVFASNLWSAMIMFFWNNGNIWVHSVTDRPALDVVSAALFFIGVILLIARYIRSRHWTDLFLLVAVPLLMMPSILSLAFPEENPSLNRTGGAIVPVFIIAAIALDAVVRQVKTSMGVRWGYPVAGIVVAALLIGSSAQNFDLVFHQFDQQFMGGAWNTSQIGQVVRGFASSIGTPDTAYVVPYPYWVDTRLVGINAGYPTKDYALWPKDFEKTLPDPHTKMFILKTEDQEDLATLVALYPQGVLSNYKSGLEGKDFVMYLVPGVAGNQP
jgi:hypothetical protein